jgi:CubicO group peptidase (beta-lactamase class C family)
VHQVVGHTELVEGCRHVHFSVVGTRRLPGDGVRPESPTVIPPDDPRHGAEPLAMVDDWGAGVATAAAVDATGGVHRHGDTTQVVRIASVTKLCTAWATLVAVEEGAIALSDPLGPAGSTVRHLLCHASGLDFDTDAVIAPPGRRRIYSNTGYDLLAEQVGAASGIPFADYLAEAVLAPLGMRSSELRGSAAKDLHSNVEDLLAFSDELVHPRLLHPTPPPRRCTSSWTCRCAAGWG